MEVMKQLRQRAIRDLVEQRPIRTQQELAAALRDRGFQATQATISRDVAELGLGKGSREGRAAYVLPPRLRDAEVSGEDRLRRLLVDVPVEFRVADLILVIKTLPGSAHAVAAALDRTRWPEIIGSIAGDDTVFVATGDRSSLRRLRDRLIGLSGRH
jgi:transcriptional regulator of arginine metabolism